MKKLFLYLFTFICFCPLAYGQSRSSLPDSVTHRIDSTINALMKSKQITGSSVAIVDHGKVVYMKGFGYANKRKQIKVTENTIFGIGSTTKTFTAMAIMKLRDEGKLDLEKPASYYLPELKIKSLTENGDILKLKNLLSHTSGLPDDVLNGDMCGKEVYFTTVIKELNEQVLVNKTNYRFSYSNIAFDLLGCIVERVSGMKYEDYIRKNFLDKMDMRTSGLYNHPEDTAFAKGYTKDTVETAEPILRDMPAGRLFCSARDMSHFVATILDNGKYNGQQIVPASGLADMETIHTRNTEMKGGTDYGYGMFINKMYNAEDSIIGDGVGHPGDTYVFHASCVAFTKAGFGFVILCNSENGHSFCNTSVIKLYNIYVQKVMGIKLHPIPKKSMAGFDINEINTHEIAGRYTDGFTEFKIKRGNDKKLVMKGDGQHLILKMHEDSTWSVKARVFKVLKVKAPGVFFGFEKKDGDIYIKEIDKTHGIWHYALIKDKPLPMSPNWKNMAGKYKAINSCDGNQQGIPELIKVKKNKIYMIVRFDKKVTNTYAFNTINDNLAVMDGMNRRSGMIMKILPNGHLYFSGYELVKQ